MIEYYHKINGIFKRYTDGKNKGRFIMGEWAVPEFGYLADNEWSFSEKIDGTSSWVHYSPDAGVEYGGRTPRSQMPIPLMQWMQNHLAAETFAKAGFNHDVQIFGEGVGTGIQKVGHLYGEQRFVLFDVRIANWWLRRDDVADIADKLGIEVAPEIGTGTIQDAIDIVSTGITFNDAGAVVRWGRGGLKSAFHNELAEGIVARPKIDLFDRAGRRIITKVKQVDFR